MAESFVPQNTKVICTMMTTSSPLELKATRSYITIHKNKDQPLLTRVDNKISASFGCKNTSKLWGGFQALCIGIALGAAIVLTGGLAAAVIISALALSIIAGGTAVYKMAHDCDATLQVKWEFSHKKVNIQGEQALLNKSTLTCPKGGLVNIIMDPVIAADAASQISNNNNNEILIHMSAQFTMGAVGVVTGGAAAAVLTAGLMMVGYFPGEALGAKLESPTKTNVSMTGITEVAAVTFGKEHEGILLNKEVGNVIKGGYQYTKSLVTGSVTEGFEGAVRVAVSQNAMKAKGGNLAIGGLLANLTIGIVSDMAEDSLAEKTSLISIKLDERDSSNGINVIAKKG